MNEKALGIDKGFQNILARPEGSVPRSRGSLQAPGSNNFNYLGDQEQQAAFPGASPKNGTVPRLWNDSHGTPAGSVTQYLSESA